MFKKLHLFSLLFLGSSLLSLANSPLVVDNTQDKFFILKEDKIDILVDYEKRLNFADVVKLPGHFRKIPDKWINKDRKYIFERGNNAAYWIRFTIENRSEAHKHWLIEFLDFNVEKVDLYIPNGDGTYQHHQAGSAYNFLFRPIRHKNFEFAIPYSPKAMVCYVRVEPGISNVFAAELKSYESFIAYSVTEYYLLGLFYGFVLLMGIYNLILYMNMRERQYLFYVFYVICVGLSSMCHDGTGFQYLWPDLPRWNENILTCSLFGMVLWTLFYSKWFLNIRFHAPLTNKIIDIMIVAVLGLLVFIQTFSWDYSVFLIPAAGIPFLLIYITGIRIFRQGFRPAWYFLMAFTFFFLGFIIRTLTFFNLIEGHILTVYSYNFGVLIEMVLFSIAIGDKIRNIKLEKEKALMEKEAAQQQIIYQLKENEILKDKVNRELEAKVAQRTLELNEKNTELVQANEKLKDLTDQANQWNLRLDKDNRQLQENVKELAHARVLMKDVTPDEFSKIFPDENSCFKYLADMKWKEGYECKKCKNINSGKGKTIFSRRCTRCNYEESPTNGTLFHRLKFPISKAFYMVYLVSIKDPGITSDQLSEILDLRRETCWSFKKKITTARKSSRKPGKDERTDSWTSILNFQNTSE